MADKNSNIRRDYSAEFLDCIERRIPSSDLVSCKRFKVCRLAVSKDDYNIQIIAKQTGYKESTVIETLKKYNQYGIPSLFDQRKNYTVEYILNNFIIPTLEELNFSNEFSEWLYSKIYREFYPNHNYSTETNETSSCFIATACEADATTLDILYSFRDSILMNSPVGINFVKIYYKYSPAVANLIKASPVAKRIILYLLIKPVSKIIKLMKFVEL